MFSIVRTPAGPWEDIAAGWWEPASGHFDIGGELIPNAVLAELSRLNPPAAESGRVEVQHGDFRYRMAYGWNPKAGH